MADGVRLLTLMMLLMAGLQGARAEPCLRLGADESLDEPAFAAFEDLFQDLYTRAGLCVQSVPMDPKRIEQQLEAGDLDGDWFRPEDYIALRHRNFLALPQPIIALEARFIWLASVDFSGKPEDLKGRTVGYQAGFRWIEGHLPQLGATPFAVTSTAQVSGLLERGRIAVFATSGAHAPHVMAAFGHNAAYVHSAEWAKVPFFHLLHGRHADKVAPLNAALVAMIRSGEIGRYLTMPGVTAIPAADQ